MSKDNVGFEHKIQLMLNDRIFCDEEGDIDSEIDESDEDPDFEVPNDVGSDMSDSSDESDELLDAV